jgi:NAD(P)H dehydrogenase (quinone)
LVPAGARSDEIAAKGYLKALQTTWIEGTFGYFGFSPRKLELLCGATGSAQRRDELLAKSYEIGLRLPLPGTVDQTG